MASKTDLINDMCEVVEDLGKTEWIDQINTTMDGMITTATGSTVFTGLATAATMLVTCYYLLHLVKATFREHKDSESILKELALACFFIYMVGHMDVIVNALSGMCNNITNTVSGGLAAMFSGYGDGSTSALQDGLREKYKDTKLLPLMMDLVLYKWVGKLASWVIRAVAYLATFTVRIEIIVRTLLLPIGVSSMPESGWQGPGGRYIKRWAGCYLQMAVISAAIHAYPYVLSFAAGGAGEDVANSVDMPFVALLSAAFATAGLVMKSSSLAHEIAGGG